MENYSVIGLMSGTSCDGLDIALCQFSFDGSWSFDIQKCHTTSFPEQLKNRLFEAHQIGSSDLAKLDVDLGKWMGQEVSSFLRSSALTAELIGSHGHTIFHRPELGFSLQIGNGWWLSKESGLRSITDFRMKDISLGGQGAPLVPIGDKLLFGDYDYCLNLGGISNISMDISGQRIAFDCTPFNGLLNHYARELGAEFDRDGIWAKEGKVSEATLQKLNELPYYQKSGAKSLGREDIEEFYAPILDQAGLTPKDSLATLVEHYAIQIAHSIATHQKEGKASLLITGGGAYNACFIERLSASLPENVSIVLPSSDIIEFKEALIFAFLAILRHRGEINCLASVTGAESDSSGGLIHDYRSSQVK